VKYSYKLTLTIIAIACLIIGCYFSYSHKKISSIYSLQTENAIIDLKKNFIKDTVNNIIIEIESARNISIDQCKKTADEKLFTFASKNDLSEAEFTNFLVSDFKSYTARNYWTVFLWNNKTHEVLYKTDDLEVKSITDTLEILESELLVNKTITHGNLEVVFGVSKRYIDEAVKEFITNKIRNSKFSDNSYIWVNEILNYQGGANFAIRRVHPNLPDTEGMYLSTDMKDIKGNLPYLKELEGVNENGELYYNYYFKELDSNKVSEKLAYSKLYKGFNWVISMGVYLDDIKEYTYITNEKSKAMLSNLSLMMILTLLSLLLISFSLLISTERFNYKHTKKQLESEINQDVLTKAYSRKFGTNELIKSFKSFKINNTNPGIMILDIDKFKTINDTYGHHTGDIVLKEVVHAINHITRDSDKLIRWGGDEFIGIFHGLREENALILSEKILLEVSNVKIPIGDDIISPSVSIGFSYFKKSDKEYTEVLKRADDALYDSKVQGRNKSNIIL